MARQLHVIGPFRGHSGYDRHTRAYVRAFVKLGVDVRLTPLLHWSVDAPADERDGWFEELVGPIEAETVLHCTMPHHAQAVFGKRNVNHTMFEADRIPRDWVTRSWAHDLIAVPTESSRSAWIGSGVPAERVGLAPLGVDASFYMTPSEPAPLRTQDQRAVSTYQTRFLNIADLRPRKNHTALIRVWLRATAKDDDAVLILKSSADRAGDLEKFRQDLLDVQRQAGRSLADAAPLLFITHPLSDGQMRALYASATHYISLSHGEGWDQPMMEAAVSGLRLIAPRHSAYLTYLREGEAHLLPAPLASANIETRLGVEDNLFFEGLRWWNPDEDAAVDLVRRIIRGDEPPLASPRDRIARDYTWDRAASALLDLTVGPQ
jgi:glycosyltransferase involved in cell wall biosynthesis